MYFRKPKQRTDRTVLPGTGLRRLTRKEANETVGGRAAQPNISGIGGSSFNDLAQRMSYVQG